MKAGPCSLRPTTRSGTRPRTPTWTWLRRSTSLPGDFASRPRRPGTGEAPNPDLNQACHRLALTHRSELLGSVGKPAAGVGLRLLDDAGSEVPPTAAGEIVVRGPQVMDRYWDDPEATKATVVDGWLHTGDIGRFDEAGNLYIVDRKKDMILTGGENVASREVEEVLVKHPEVSKAAVVGLEDSRWGEAVWAAVVVRPESEVIGEELLAYCRSQLAAYKTPKQLQIVKELPVNASGKIDKRQVRELLRLGAYAVFPAAL